MTTPSSFYPGLAPQTQMFTDILIDKRAVEPFVVKTYPQFNLYNKITEALGGSQLKRSGQRLYDIYHKGNTFPAATIAKRTANGNQLILTWDDQSFASLIPGNAVQSANTGVWGLVQSTIPGEATIVFLVASSGATSFTSSDFVLGTTVSDRGDVSNVQSSSSKQRITFKPYRTQNVVGQIRHTAELGYDEMNTLTFIDNINGQPYYALNAVMDALEYVASVNYVRTITGVFHNDPVRPIGGGLEWQIQNQGGTYYPLSNVIDEDTFQAVIDQMIANGATPGSELLLVGGSSFIGYFQRFMKTYIVTAGVSNTVGGSTVKGIDVMTYAYNGKVIKVINDPCFDNPQVWNAEYSSVATGVLKRSHSAFIFDTSPVKTEQGTVPFMTKYYFGQNDMFMSKVNGLVTVDNSVASVATNSTMSGKLEIVYNVTTQLNNAAAHAYVFLSV